MDSKTSRKGSIISISVIMGLIFLNFGYITLAVLISISPEILIGLIVCGYLLIIISSILVMKNKNLKRFLDLGVMWGAIGAYFILIYYQVNQIEGYHEDVSKKIFYLDNAEIIKSTILFSAIVFILIGTILIFYYLRKKAREEKLSIQINDEKSNVNLGEKPPINAD